MDPLGDEDRDFLLSLVDNPHSDYDESCDGYPNYRVEQDKEYDHDTLVVTFYDPDSETTYVGRWALAYISGDITTKED